MLKFIGLAVAGALALAGAPAAAALIQYQLTGSFGLAGSTDLTAATLTATADTANAFTETVDNQAVTIIPIDAASLTIGAQTADLPVSSAFFSFPELGFAGFEFDTYAAISFTADALIGFDGTSEVGPLNVAFFSGFVDLSGGNPIALTAENLTFTARLLNVAVPEPATWAMMIAGFALTGAALRRRGGAAVPA